MRAQVWKAHGGLPFPQLPASPLCYAGRPFAARFSTVNIEFDEVEVLYKAFAAELPPEAAVTAGEAFIDGVFFPFCQVGHSGRTGITLSGVSLLCD